MDGIAAAILRVKKRLDSDTLEDEKMLKYLRALDEIPIDFDILKTTGIGKSVNNLKKRGGNISVLSKALVKKWRDLVPNASESPQKTSSPLNTSNFSPAKKTDDKDDKPDSEQETKLESPQKTEDNRKRKNQAPSMQLCDLSFVSKEPVSQSRKVKRRREDVPRSAVLQPSRPISHLPSAEEIGAALLPDIQPNYIPQRHPSYPDDNPLRRNAIVSCSGITADLLSSRKSKTQVFSGRRAANKTGVVTSLYDMCIRVLIENIEALYDTGGVPYEILEPVLAKCSPEQLWNLEDYNPYFIDDTGPLWRSHCHKDFKGRVPEEHDDWRALYVEKHEERERKLKSINAKISASQAAKTPVRQVKMAFIQTQAKAPPTIRRKQMKHGTGGPNIIAPVRSTIKGHSSSSTSSQRRVQYSSPKKSKPTALMKKVKQMGNLHRSRAKSSIIRR